MLENGFPQPGVLPGTRAGDLRAAGALARPPAVVPDAGGREALRTASGQAGATDDGEELRPGLDPRQQRVATLMAQLATTSRSFLLYDIRNEAIRNFLSSLLDGFLFALDVEPEIALTVQPFELWFEGTPVYINRDRERSLAFRLYRDGVRSMRFVSGFHWDELARLLEILSIRYTGVHQHEDDVVTLLWKANFKHLDVVAVEGFIPEDERPAEGDSTLFRPGPASGVTILGVRLPDQVDLSRLFLPAGSLGWVSVPEESLEAMRAEVSSSALPDECLALLSRLRTQLDDITDPLRFDEVAHLFSEVRDFLLTEEHLASLTRFVLLMREMASEASPPWDLDRQDAQKALLQSCGDHRAVLRLLNSVPSEQRQLRPPLLHVLELVCEDPFPPLIDALAAEHRLATRAIARQLLEHYGAGRGELLRQRFTEAGGHVSADLLRVLARIGGETALGFIALQLTHSDPAVQDEALAQLERLGSPVFAGRALHDALGQVDFPRQRRILALLARIHDERVLELMIRYVEEHAGRLEPEQAMEMGRTLGQMSGRRGMARWEAWLKPKGLFRRVLPGAVARQVVAAFAMATIPDEHAAQALRAALVLAGDEARTWIGQALSTQRSLGRKDAP